MNFYRDLIFTLTPLKGGFRYKDVFQIFPAELKNLPQSSHANHFPVILEYCISDDEIITPTYLIDGLEDLSIETASRITKVEEILKLLSTFTNHFFYRYEAGTGFWGMPIIKDNPGEEANSWSSVWCFKMLFWPDLPNELKTTSFTQFQDHVPLEAHHPYFFTKPNLDINTETQIIFPHSIIQFCEAYFSANDERKKIVLRAMNHLYNAVELFNRKQTLSMISAFTSLESMIHEEFKDQPIENCDSCGQPRFRVTKKFRDYLTTYVGQNTSLKKKFNLYYKKRSKIIHTGEELATEDLYSDLPKNEKDADSITHQEVLQISRLAINHWLWIKHTKP